MSRTFVAACRNRVARWTVCLFLLATTGAVVLLSGRGGLADPNGPQQADRQVTLAVSALLKREHLSRHPLDDEISERWLKTYLKTLDPFKVYFMQSDIDEFNEHKDDLDDWAKQGDIRFGYTIFKRFLERLDERVKWVDELLTQPHDFSVNEDMITDPDATTYAKTTAESKDLWRKRIKYDLLVLEADKDKLEGKAAQEKLSRRYHSLGKRMHQTDSDELLEMYLTALTTSYDPHTTYMSPGSLENFEIQMRLNLEGIGAALQFTDGYTVVSKIIPGGAADKDKRLKPEDKVVGVGQGTEGEIVDVVDMKLNDVVKLIRGERGTVVRLKVLPAGQGEPKIYAITREQIELTDSEARSEVIEAGRRPDGTPYKIGVIDLPSFYMDMSGAREGLEDFKSTTRDVAKLLKKFNEQKVDLVVLDLRQNGGGSLTESINLTGLFIDTGPVVQVKDADKRVQHYDDQDRGMAWNGPLVVLTSKFSASASEIFAGAIQDYRRGLVIGDSSTHGKGTVQSLLDLGKQLFRGLPNSPQLGALEDHHAAVLSPQRRQHPEPRRAGRRRFALADQPAGRGRIEPGLRRQVRPCRPGPLSPLRAGQFGNHPAAQDRLGPAPGRLEGVGESRQEHRPLQRSEEAQAGFAQRAGVPGRTGRGECRQGRREGAREAGQPEPAGLRHKELLQPGNPGPGGRLPAAAARSAGRDRRQALSLAKAGASINR